MKTIEHVEKANRIEKTIIKLDPENDQEIIVWGLMHICSHWLNAALHYMGLTEWYWDINHTSFLDSHPDKKNFYSKIDKEFRDSLNKMLTIENIRDPYVRGRADWEPCIIEKAFEAYRFIKGISKNAIAI